LLADLSPEERESAGHCLKLIKRSMYGRAKFDLLRLRVTFDGAIAPGLLESSKESGLTAAKMFGFAQGAS